MPVSLEGRHIVVIGASRGLGFSVVSALLEMGARVTAIARGSADLATAHQHWTRDYPMGSVSTFDLDMSVVGSADALSERLSAGPPVDGLVVCAGSGRPVQGSRQDRMNAMIAANVAPALNAMDALEEQLSGSQDSSVVLVSSIAGRERVTCPPEYAAAKAALSALVAHWAASLTPVRVNAVCPGNMLTDGSVWRRLAQESPGELDAFLKAEVPLGRVAESSEIAQAILFLLSHHASFVTGATLVVDGGQSRSFA